MIKNAMILAAGFGTRLHPLTFEHPKPLLKIGNVTLLSNAIKFLELFGIKQVVINVHYLGEQIIDYINKKKFNLIINMVVEKEKILSNNNFNLNIRIVEEKNEILDTGGGVLNAIKYFSNQPFLIINPDTIWSQNYLNDVKLFKKQMPIKSIINNLKFIENKKKYGFYFVGGITKIDKNSNNFILKQAN